MEANTKVLLGIGALAALAYWYSSSSTASPFKKISAPKSDDKTDADVAAILASVPAPVVPAPVATVAPGVQITAAPGASPRDQQTLARMGRRYLDAIIDLNRRAGFTDPAADIRGMKVARPRQTKTVLAAGQVPFTVTPSDRIVATSTLTRGTVFYALLTTKPASWPYADWAFSFYPVVLGTKVITQAATREPSVAVPITTPLAATSTTEFTAIPNGGYLGSYL